MTERELAELQAPFCPQRLLIAGASVRAAWQSAARSADDDHWPIVETADLFGDVDVLDSDRFWLLTPGYDNLVEVIEASRPDAWIYTGALENRPDLIAIAAQSSRLWGCSSECLVEVRDPALLDEALRRAGCHFPQWSVVDAGLPRDGSWLRKRRASAAGLGVMPLTEETELDASDERWYYQRRVEGRSCGAVFAACDGQAWLWGVTQQWHGPRYGAPRPYQYAGSLGPLALSAWERDAWNRIGQTLCQRFPLEGIFGVDAIVTENAVVVLEVNPRWTASVEVLERATGRSAMTLHWQACQQRRIPHDRDRHAASDTSESSPRLVGKAIVYARKPVVASRDFIAWMTRENSLCQDDWPVLADRPRPDTTFKTGDPIVSAFVTRDGRVTQAWQQLERRLEVYVDATHAAIEAR